jgi:hypothetical protein
MSDILGDFSKMLGVESGNRQKNRDGSTVTSPKGAAGIAQIMPDTGPEAARLAGLPWDEKRFKDDATYNASLGQAYYNAQLTRFGGDARAAQAAYNAGPTRVERLRTQYGKDWEAHLPAETTDYLAKINGVVSQPMKTVDPNTAIATSADTSTMTDLFGVADQAQGAHRDLMTADDAAQDVLTQATQQIHQIQDQRVALAQDAVADSDAVRTDISAGVENLREKLKPIFGARAQLAERRLELTKMNPIKREILSIFNRNYSKDHIEELDRGYAAQAAEAGNEFEVTQQLNNTMMQVISGNLQAHDSLQQLLASNIGANMELAEKSVSYAGKKFGDILSGISASTQITQAQLQAKDVTMTQLTPEDVNTYLAQARRNGGVVTVNGVPLSEAELGQRNRQIQQQNMSLESMQLGLQNQRQNIADDAESRLISHMSLEDLNTTIKNGGVFKGQQLDQVKLTSALSAMNQRTTIGAAQMANSLDSSTFVGAVDAYKQSTTMQIGRIAAVTGNQMPKEFRGFSQRFIQISQEYQQKFNNASEEMKPVLRKQFVEILGQLQEESDKSIDKVAQGMTRDPDGQILLGAWMKGNTVSAEQTTKGILALGRGGALPPGVRFSGPAGAAIKAGIAAANKVEAQYDNSNLRPGQLPVKKPNAAALQAEKMEAVTKAVQAQWVGGNTNQIMGNLPQLAAQRNDPFGQISMSDYRAAQVAGDRAGVEKLAQKLGWTTDEVDSVFVKRNVDYKSKNLDDKSFAEGRRQIDTESTIGMLRALDHSPSGQKLAASGKSASEAMVNFMRSDGMQQGLGQMEGAVGRASFGGMVADSISQGGIGEMFNRKANVFAQAQGAIHDADTQSVRDRAAGYAGSPMKRMDVILSAIPGLNPMEERAFAEAVRGVVGYGSINEVLEYLPGGTQGPGEAVSQHIDNIIKTHKFEDPRIEKIRQRAAKDWDTFASASDRAISRLQNQE